MPRKIQATKPKPNSPFDEREIVAREAGRLDEVLRDMLPIVFKLEFTNAFIRKLIAVGAVWVGGRPCNRLQQSITRGGKIRVRILKAELEKRKSFVTGPTNHTLSILYEDDTIIVVNKPFGIPTHQTLDPKRKNLFQVTKDVMKARSGKDSQNDEPYLAVHHRLDRDTSGVVLFCKDRSANAAITEMFTKRSMQKQYLAVVRGAQKGSKKSFTVQNFLGEIARKGKQKRFGEVRSGGDAAETDFEILADAGKFSLILAKPHTGRTHQIRVHLAGSGMPIIGDELYDPDFQSADGRMLLHAWQLAFKHPITNEEMSVVAPIPAEISKMGFKNPAVPVR
jgi:RluA family pseudouridine synthase